MATVAIDVLVTFVTKLVHIRIFLVVVFDSAAVIAGVSKVVLVHVALVHVWHQHAVVLVANRRAVRQAIQEVSARGDGRHTCVFGIPSPSASSSQASPIPSLSASSWPEFGTERQLS